MAYFKNFPKINYLNEESRNIILKAALVSKVFENADAFFPYVIKDYERPDIIAFTEYGDELLDWVVYFSNDIVDPYYSWPLFPEQWKGYMEKKYNKSLYELQGDIRHYKYVGITGESSEDIARKSWLMTPTTHARIGDTTGWAPVSVYDYEQELNDAKRSIKLLNKYFIPQLEKELKTIFNT